jgi:GNAT superfamily N-acetyltransferase
MNNIEKFNLIEVISDKDLDVFINFQWEVYKNDKSWVPPLKSEVRNILSDKNPFWKHAEKKLFLLYDENRLVGRIAGIIDKNYISFQNENAGFFGFFEVFNNIDYAKMLIEAVKDWLKNKGIEIMYGPMNPSTNDEMGFFFEGQEGSPMLMMPYNPNYYINLMEQMGLEKAKDLYAYMLDYNFVETKKLKVLKEKLAKKIADKNVVIRNINMRNLDSEINFALDVYNNAWEKNWGFVPWTREEFYNIADTLKKLADPRLILFLEVDKKPAGMLIVVPDYNQVMKKMNGKLNILKFLWFKRKMNQARLMILGVKKEFRKQGFESLLYLTAVENVKKTGFKYFEFSWILEDNILTQRAAEMMGGKLYRKYRVYKSLI